ncbi:unnamed protein product [Leptosia nina]|uniref:Uncharacterized protein n=1 Tax=Leptosia nina TaxID=320188 RepID=A0AAV1IWS2_9NEOP
MLILQFLLAFSRAHTVRCTGDTLNDDHLRSHPGSRDRELPGKEFLMDEVPLSKSLGFSAKRLGRTLEDAHLGKEFKELYQEMMRASQEMDPDDLDEYISHTDLTRLKGIANRRRSVISSQASKRRARSQAIRREKLNGQSLRSHMEHSRQNNMYE